MAVKNQQQQVLSEDDTRGDEEIETPGDVDTTPEKLSPQRQAPIRQGAEPEDEYDILEVDNDGAAFAREGTLSEQDDEKQQQRRQTLHERIQQEKQEAADAGVSRSTFRRRRARQDAKAREQENDRLKRELNELRTRVGVTETRVRDVVETKLADFDRRGVEQQVLQYDRQIADLEVEIEAAENAMAEAVTNSDGAAIKDALKKRDKNYIDRVRLENERKAVKDRIAQATEGGQEQTGDGRQQQGNRRADNQPLPPRATNHLNRWMSENDDWFDPKSSSKDGRREASIVRMLDNEIAGEGFDPNTEEYWDELTKRCAEMLPHRFPEEDDEPPARQDKNGRQQQRQPQARQQERQQERQPQERQPQRRGPMTAGAGERSGKGGSKVQVKIGPARREAMQLAGIIDAQGKVLDSKKFKGVLRGYAEQDRADSADR